MALDNDTLTWLNLPKPLLLLAGLAIYIFSVGIYRLYFHPLAKFPGPKLAANLSQTTALTDLYCAYHDLGRGGQYIWEVEKMHKKYGPVVRIKPNSLHVNDPAFVDKLYTQSPKNRRDRHWSVFQSFMAPGSMVATADHELHRRRRAVLHPYFSMQNVRRLEPIVNDTLASLLHRMDGWADENKPWATSTAFRAATKDVIHLYAFGEGGRAQKCLDMEDCNAGFFDVLTPNRMFHLGVHALWATKAISSIPPSIIMYLMPRISVFAAFLEGLYEQIDDVREAKDLPEGKTIFHEIMRSNIPESEKETKRLGDEAMVLVMAGSETTASTLSVIMYHLLADPQLLARVKAELLTAMPDPNELPVAARLDHLSLLNAVIEESIRLYPGASFRQERMAPEEDLVLEAPGSKSFVIPAGTPIGMTAPLINRHPDLYYRPDEFIPERYLQNPNLKKSQFAFSKGGRQCLGINLAYQELQTFTAGIFRKYDVYDPTKEKQNGPTLELYQTEMSDLRLYADYATPGQRPGSKGLRVIIRR
ncbi:cytochrome P450 [Xylariaceae sp. FL0255]|nr:cytochrome P450 [Xylariaceae sp. FL0255]